MDRNRPIKLIALSGDERQAWMLDLIDWSTSHATRRIRTFGTRFCHGDASRSSTLVFLMNYLGHVDVPAEWLTFISPDLVCEGTKIMLSAFRLFFCFHLLRSWLVESIMINRTFIAATRQVEITFSTVHDSLSDLEGCEKTLWWFN